MATSSYQYPSKAPRLRFPEFNKSWELKKISEAMSESRIQGTNGEKAKKLTVKLWGKGVFSKNVMGSSNTKYFTRRAGQFIYSKLDFLNCAFGIIPDYLDGYESTLDLPALDIKNDFDPRFILERVKQKDFYIRWGETADGTRKARRIHVDTLLSFSIYTPEKKEQQKIANFISQVNSWLLNLRSQKELLEKYKSGIVKGIFSQTYRFKKTNGNAEEKWSKKRLIDFLEERLVRNKNNEHREVFSVAKGVGIVNQIEHLGRAYASDDLSNYKVVDLFDVVYTKSPTADFPYGIIKQNKTGRKGLVSTLYAVYKPNNKYIGALIHEYFLSWTNTYNYLNPLVHKGAKNTMNISNTDFLKGKLLSIPTSEIEQIKITEFLTSIDKEIESKKKQILDVENWKKGLLQHMFA